MSTGESIVHVIDDDASMRAAIADLLESLSIDVRTFDSVATFLSASLPEADACLILDIRMPGISGLEFQRQMADLGIQMPVIFITAHGDIPMSVQAMKAGAVDFLVKPFRDQELLDAIQSALSMARERRHSQNELSALKQRYDTLTNGEKDVLLLVVHGLLNKQIADRLSVSEITVKVRRSHIRQKLEVSSVAEMTRIALQLGLIDHG